MAFKITAWVLGSMFLLRSEAIDVANMHVKNQSATLLPTITTLTSNFSCPLLLISKQYQEMSCTVSSYRNATFLYCPREYDCSAIDQRSYDKCVYKNQTYEVGSSIPDKLMKVRCKSKCVCTLDEYGVASFVCKTQECPVPTEGCRQQYKSHLQCCPVENCNARKKKEKNCKYLHEWFTYGEVVHHNFQQKRCLCQKGFDGTMKGKWCRSVECGIELDSQNTVRQGCSPVYSVNITGVTELMESINDDYSLENLPQIDVLVQMFNKLTSQLRSVCPIYWICPSAKDLRIPAMLLITSMPDIDPSTECTFGNKVLLLLDVIMTPELEDGSCTMCTCLMPPMLSCVYKNPCWTF